MDEKDKLIKEIQILTGREYASTRTLLKILVHPNVIEYTKRYISSMDEAARCRKFIAPWSCSKEAEAKYENLQFGWLGSSGGLGFDETWCEPCRKRVME